LNIKKIKKGLKKSIEKRFSSGASISRLRDITVGWETQIVSFNLNELDETKHELVARIFPSNKGLGCEKESIIMQRLRAAGYPVPLVFFYEKNPDFMGSPFLVMERIEGGALWDVFFRDQPNHHLEVMNQTSKLLNDLHSIDPSKVFPINEDYNTKNRINDRLIIESNELTKVQLYDEFGALVDWLKTGLSQVVDSQLCIIHRDFHPRNILLRKDGSPVVIDWGSCDLGDFREDLCWTGLLINAYIDRNLKESFYNSYFSNTSRKRENLDYFEVFNGFRRLSDFYISKTAGAEVRGMNPEATEKIIENKTHIKKICEILTEITGLNLNIQ
jgi:aminoglycoside phosphotransferase (APT) family kinase protein